MQGGILNKARRGELEMRLPVGLVYNSEAGDWCSTPIYRSNTVSVGCLKPSAVPDPRRPPRKRRDFRVWRSHDGAAKGPHKGELLWTGLDHSQVLRILHNPRYAGAFVYGRTHTRKTVDGGSRVCKVPRDQWDTLIPGAHAGYLSWEEYEQNQRRLQESAYAMGTDRRRGPPREGPALLQGLVVCGRCGNRMTVRYHSRLGGLCPEYVCQREGVEHAEPICLRIPGVGIDQAIGDLLVEAVNPVALEVTLAVQRELQSRMEEADRLRHQQVERAQYEADLAQRRYMRVDPDNRLVADSLEADWNHKLRALAETQEEYTRRREQDTRVLTDEQRTNILALASDFPRLWRDPTTPDRERKRMVRLLLEDVTLNRDHQITLQIRFKGGAHRMLNLPVPLQSWQKSVTPSVVIEEIDQLLNDHTTLQIATILNERGIRSGAGKPFHPHLVARLVRTYELKPRYDRLREAGLLSLQEMADALHITPTHVKIWNRHGLIRGHPYSDKNECLYEPPTDETPRKAQGTKLSLRRLDRNVVFETAKEVQCET